MEQSTNAIGNYGLSRPKEEERVNNVLSILWIVLEVHCRLTFAHQHRTYLERWRIRRRRSLRRFMRFLCHLGRMPPGRLTEPMVVLFCFFECLFKVGNSSWEVEKQFIKSKVSV